MMDSASSLNQPTGTRDIINSDEKTTTIESSNPNTQSSTSNNNQPTSTKKRTCDSPPIHNTTKSSTPSKATTKRHKKARTVSHSDSDSDTLDGSFTLITFSQLLQIVFENPGQCISTLLKTYKKVPKLMLLPLENCIRKLLALSIGDPNQQSWTEFLQHLKKQKMVHDVTVDTEHRDIQDISYDLTRRMAKITKGISLFYVHRREGWKHIHFIHDCSFLNSTCRCSILSSVSVKRRQSNKIHIANDLSSRYWRNLLFYFLKKQIGEIFLQVDTSYLKGLCHENNHLSFAGSEEDASQRLVENTCQGCPDSSLNGTIESPLSSRHTRDLSGTSKSSIGTSYPGRERRVYAVSRVLLKHPCSPLKDTKYCLSNPYLCQIKQETWEKAEIIAKRALNHLDIETLYKYLHNKLPEFTIEKLYLGVIYQDFEHYYMKNIEETDSFTEELLQFQFEENFEKICHRPDMNPIEHLWKALEDNIRKRRISNKNDLKQALQDEEDKIPSSTTANLVRSMPQRLQAITAAKGNPSKY
ncbi:uncharacterized protein [Anabrus simplex]|uniref:uncharacterized protein n=1 Tax=Anabrus simplex TaxID=316456 RepID=UPI0035A385CD